jgi:hypothetical protein
VPVDGPPMLSHRDKQRIRSEFEVFDHEWSFYASSRGEPFLVGDFLVYFDGVLLCVCAFRLGDAWNEASIQQIQGAVEAVPEFALAQGMCLWGRYVSIDAVELSDGKRLERTAFKDYDETFVDAVIDLGDFDYSRHRKARLAANAVAKGDLRSAVVQRDALLAEHFALIQDWANGHDVSPRSAGVLAGLTQHVCQDHVYLVECRLDGSLVGFTILALVGHRAIFSQGFSRRIDGERIGDALYAKMIAFAKERDMSHLHLGYSPSSNLVRFKEKWGGRRTGPPFRDSLFTDSGVLTRLYESGRFRWHDRLVTEDPIPLKWNR